MLEKIFRIKNKLGIHARPAALLAQLASKFESNITLAKGEQKADAKSILGIMMLAIEYGSNLKVIADGVDEKLVIHKIGELINRKFDEK